MAVRVPDLDCEWRKGQVLEHQLSLDKVLQPSLQGSLENHHLKEQMYVVYFSIQKFNNLARHILKQGLQFSICNVQTIKKLRYLFSTLEERQKRWRKKYNFYDDTFYFL